MMVRGAKSGTKKKKKNKKILVGGMGGGDGMGGKVTEWTVK